MDIPQTPNCLLVHSYARREGILYSYSTMQDRSKRRKGPPFWLATLRLGERKFPSYPAEKPTQEEAKEAAAARAVSELGLHQSAAVVTHPVTPASTPEEIAVLVRRLTSLVLSKPHGVLKEGVEPLYKQNYSEQLPGNWFEHLVKSNAVHVERGNRCILYPLGGKANSTTSQSAPVQEPVQNGHTLSSGSTGSPSSSTGEPSIVTEYVDVFVSCVASTASVCFRFVEYELEVFVSVGEALKGYLGWNQHAASAQIVEGNVHGWQFVIEEYSKLLEEMAAFFKGGASARQVVGSPEVAKLYATCHNGRWLRVQPLKNAEKGKKKRKTAQQFGARKPKLPIVKKKFSLATSASSNDGVWHDKDLEPSTSTHGASSASIDKTVDMPLEQCFVPSEETSPRFVSAEASRERAAAVQESLRAASVTERKTSLMDQGDKSDIETEDEDEFFLMQRTALNGLYGSALCPQCEEPGLKMKHGTKHGLAVKMVLTCTACGADAKNAWSSPRMENSKSFEVNIRAMQAMMIGKGSAALSDFWSAMNVSHRGIHHKASMPTPNFTHLLVSNLDAMHFVECCFVDEGNSSLIRVDHLWELPEHYTELAHQVQ
ncbi:hypothetical protein HPB52_004169 [Rhipicephalus sanguineus]|uniref:Mutator-like transposase domain-containing protein n=1 Tax=Rhipicephalus sanguineus TaxID=34632 RepID=A0A9D4Q4H5_RHISA|nr:hypothetical protein HPB52_004169 [Rhipicephalus sanguineus]